MTIKNQNNQIETSIRLTLPELQFLIPIASQDIKNYLLLTKLVKAQKKIIKLSYFQGIKDNQESTENDDINIIMTKMEKGMLLSEEENKIYLDYLQNK